MEDEAEYDAYDDEPNEAPTVDDEFLNELYNLNYTPPAEPV